MAHPELVAVRRPGRSKAHRRTTDAYTSTLYTNSTVCGKWARDMVVSVPLAQTAPEDRCKRCWPADTAERPNGGDA